jgi:hypothetical protein
VIAEYRNRWAVMGQRLTGSARTNLSILPLCLTFFKFHHQWAASLQVPSLMQGPLHSERKAKQPSSDTSMGMRCLAMQWQRDWQILAKFTHSE